MSSYLSHLTGNPEYKEYSDAIIDVFVKHEKYDGLLPVKVI